MTIRHDQIERGKTYRFFGTDGREVKPRTVVRYDARGHLPGGNVVSHTGKTKRGNLSQPERMAGDYFVRHAELVGVDGEEQKR